MAAARPLRPPSLPIKRIQWLLRPLLALPFPLLIPQLLPLPRCPIPTLLIKAHWYSTTHCTIIAGVICGIPPVRQDLAVVDSRTTSTTLLRNQYSEALPAVTLKL